MSEQDARQLPIGFWLKRADELLTSRIDAVQRANGLTRLEWQALATVKDMQPAPLAEIQARLRPFAEPAHVTEVVERLTARGHMARTPEHAYTLTMTGAELYSRALATQKAIRQRATAGISEAEYVIAISVLRRLVENLERED